MFTLAERAEREGKITNAETIYRALEQDHDLDTRNEARFRHGQLLVRQHRLTEAGVLYRTILDEKPDAQRVRLELAALLAQMGDLQGARRALRQAQAGGLPPDIARVVDQYASALRSLKPFGGSFELALAPDSNINRATDAKMLDTVIAPLTLSQDARARSGIGVKLSGQIYLRAPLSSTISVVPRLSGRGEVYRASQFDDISGSAQLGIEWGLKRDRLTPSAGYTWRWYGGDLYARTQSLTLNWLHPSSTRGQIDTELGVSRALCSQQFAERYDLQCRRDL